MIHCRRSSFLLLSVSLALTSGLGMPGAARAAADPLVVSTSAGQLRGIARSDGGAQFLGIPYAEPPVGNLRWRAPAAVRKWAGVRNADVYGAPCVQPDLGDWNRRDAGLGREDCLYLNVDVPRWPTKERLPVMFWIHGGSNMGGSGTGSLYNDGTLRGHGVVVVTINYRLGVFGFFAHPALTAESDRHASGDYGLLDQILALQWVHENIAKFGGDPDNVTVFGQSAGAMDIGMLMTSPLARGLFERAIAESGTGLAPPLTTLATAEEHGLQAATLVDPETQKASSAAALADLRAIPAEELRTKSVALLRAGLIGPDVDGWVIPRSPAEVFSSGQEAAVPVLIGTTTREFESSATPEEVRTQIDRFSGASSPKMLALYGFDRGGQGNADAEYGSAADQWSADWLFRCPTVTEAVWHTAAHHVVYEYELDHAIPGQPFAIHSSELPYVFGYFPKTGNLAGNIGPIDIKLADLIQTYWTNFAKAGDPNSAGLAEWKPFGENQNYIKFTEDGTVAPAHGLRSGPCTLYRAILARD
jgi:para-nitrobenzyl esterase